MKKGVHLNKIYFIVVSLIVGLFLLFVCNSTKEGQKPLVDGKMPDITFEAGNVKEQVFQKVSWSLMEPMMIWT
ncbi:MAG: hypothetical protein HFE73_08015 [Firmicutes bacterium]|nr:hypothetical protein [Bacillota bacterium]